MNHLLENNFLKISVSDAGAEMQSLYNKKNEKEYLWQGDAAFWGRRAPVLFPIVGKLNNNNFKVNGLNYSLPQHGFARDQKFELIHQKEDALVYSLKYSEETLKVYPFKFELRISYLIKNNQIEVVYEVENLDTNKIYFSIGGHPAFICPLNENEKLTDYFLEFEKEEHADTMLLAAGLVSGNTKPVLVNEKVIALNEEIFNIDTILLQQLNSSFVTLKSKKGNYSLKFGFKDFPFLAIWKKKDAPFLCIEPWEGHGDLVGFEGEIKDKKGIVALDVHSKYKASHTIELN